MKRLLWADDDLCAGQSPQPQILQNALRARLNEDLEVIPCAGSDSALRKIDDLVRIGQPPDVVVVDLKMRADDELQGTDLVFRLKERYLWIPVVVYTNYPDLAPVPPKETEALRQAVAAVVGKAGAERNHRSLLDELVPILLVESLRLVVLADVHCGIQQAIGRDVTLQRLMMLELAQLKEQHRPNLVVVSGDLGSVGSSADYGPAGEFLRFVMKTLGLSWDRLILVPGNHDIDRNARPSEAYKAYLQFVNRLYKQTPEGRKNLSGYPCLYDNSIGRLGTRVESDHALFSVHSFPSPRVQVIALNSVVSQASAVSKDIDWAQGEVLQSQLSLVQDHLSSAAGYNGTRIAVMHHHAFPVASRTRPENERSSRVVRNQGLLLAHLMDWNVRLLVHGHSHYTSLVKHERLLGEQWRTGDKCPLYVLAVGSLGGMPAPGKFFHSYARLSLDYRPGEKGLLNLRSRILTDSQSSWRDETSPIADVFSRRGGSNQRDS